MKKKIFHDRKKRVQKMNRVLHKLFPQSIIHLNHGNSWELLVAVILSAQCTDRQVNIVTEKLFKQYKTIESYSHASQKDMEKAVFSTGFYRSKARYIRESAKMILSNFNGKVPRSMKDLLTLPGVARKTANVVLANAFNTQEGIAVDTHVRRFAIRFDLSDYSDPRRIEQDLMNIMPKSEWWGFNHRLVEYGRMYCNARKHDCINHPLTKIYPEALQIWPKAH